jgi:hypothetical protein
MGATPIGAGRRLCQATVLAMALLVAPWIGVRGASGGTSGGRATLVPSSGGSQTLFSIHLPSGAACSGSTLHGYLVNGFIVDPFYDLTATSGPSAWRWGASGPVGDGTHVAYLLKDAAGTQYETQSTADERGHLAPPPWFMASVYSIDGRSGTAPLRAGTYVVGLACSSPTSQTDVFFSTRLTVVTSTTDANGETWRVVATSSTTTSNSSASLVTGLLAVSVAVVGGVVILVRRRQARLAAPSG